MFILITSNNEIIKVDFALIGGSGTLSSNFPFNIEKINANINIKIIKNSISFDTPYGKSPDFIIFCVNDKRVITCKMHGWRSGVSRADASRQIFWVFREAGVNHIISECGVGTINPLLDPRDIVIPNDYLDLSVRKDVMLDGRYLLIMREALCPNLRSALINSSKKFFPGRIFDRGIYAVTDGRHFESPAEITMLKGHADIVGQSLVPEVYLAREIGACYANFSFVVNYGEGIQNSWSYETMKDIFFDDAQLIVNILIDTIINLNKISIKCNCNNLRKDTLLKDIYNNESHKG